MESSAGVPSFLGVPGTGFLNQSTGLLGNHMPSFKKGTKKRKEKNVSTHFKSPRPLVNFLLSLESVPSSG